MSNLQVYLTENGITQRAFADALGVDQSVVSRLSRKKMNPGLPLAVRIESATGGAVPAKSWVSETLDSSPLSEAPHELG